MSTSLKSIIVYYYICYFRTYASVCKNNPQVCLVDLASVLIDLAFSSLSLSYCESPKTGCTTLRLEPYRLMPYRRKVHFVE